MLGSRNDMPMLKGSRISVPIPAATSYPSNSNVIAVPSPAPSSSSPAAEVTMVDAARDSVDSVPKAAPRAVNRIEKARIRNNPVAGKAVAGKAPDRSMRLTEPEMADPDPPVAQGRQPVPEVRVPAFDPPRAVPVSDMGPETAQVPSESVAPSSSSRVVVTGRADKRLKEKADRDKVARLRDAIRMARPN